MVTFIRDGFIFALPLFIMAIGGIYSEKSGITNLALEGLQGFGAFGGAFVAVLLTNQLGTGYSTMIYYISILVAILAGTLFSIIHALLCIKFKANQVISGVVINILAMSLTSFFTKQINRSFFKVPSDKFVLEVSQRISIPGLSKLPKIGGIFSDIYPFEIIIVVVAAVAWYLMYHTQFGLRLRGAGENPHALDSAGIDVYRIRTIAVLISGACSGLAGISFAYSISANFSSSIYVGYGYLAIAGLIFGNWKIMPTLIACFIFGFARSGGYQLVKILEFPSTYADIILTLPYILTLLLLVFFSKNNHSPKALGEIYDKGKR